MLVETAGEGGSYGESLRGSPMNAPTQGVWGDIMAWERPDTPSTEREECLLISRSAIYSSEGRWRSSVKDYLGNPG